MEDVDEGTEGSYSCRRLGNKIFTGNKTLHKEMLPIVDKPTIQHIIEEAVNCD